MNINIKLPVRINITIRGPEDLAEVKNRNLTNFRKLYNIDYFLKAKILNFVHFIIRKFNKMFYFMQNCKKIYIFKIQSVFLE